MLEGEAIGDILTTTMKRILVIDDDSEIRYCVRAILEKAGYEVLEADNGKSGIELFRRTSADLAMVDIFMPEKEGIETIRELRKGDPELKILAVSGGILGHDPHHYLNIAQMLGANGSLEKPFKQDRLLEVIGKMLELPVPA